MRTPMLYVLDEDEALSLQVEHATAALRPRPGVKWCGGFEALDKLTQDAGPTDVLVAGPLVSKDAGFQQLRDFRARLPEMALLLALDHWRSADMRDAVRTGALDVLRLPVSNAALADAVKQALDMSRSQAPVVHELDAARPGGDGQNGQGAVIAVLSATGGCGKTFFATNLAYHLQSRLGKRTCVIDLDLQFGELSTALRIKPKYTIVDLVSHDPDEDLSGRLLEHLSLHESGIHVLAAPEEPAEADSIDASDVIRVIDAAKAHFDYVIIDTPAALSDAVLVAVEMAGQLFALATLDLPSVRNLGLLLSTLKKLRVPTERMNLLLNKVEPDVGIDVARVAEYFPLGFSMVIPYGREVNRSLNMGQPVLAYAPRGEVSKSLESGLTRILAASGIAAAPVPEPSRRRSRLGAWRAKKSA